MKAFVIYLPERTHSVTHANQMIKTLTGYGLDAELFEGTTGPDAIKLIEKSQRVVYPYSIKSQHITESELQHFIRPELWDEFVSQHYYKIAKRNPIGADASKMARPGVLGCFYSHYRLWQQCADLDQSIMIFEDDVKFYRGWQQVEWEDVLILSLGKSSFRSDPYNTYLESPVGTPQPMPWANFSMPGASGYAIKPHAARSLVKFYRKYYYAADNAINQHVCKIQIHNHIMGRNTLPEEGNVSMTKYTDWL